MVDASPATNTAWIRQSPTATALDVVLGGDWVIASASDLFSRLDDVVPPADGPVQIESDCNKTV